MNVNSASFRRRSLALELAVVTAAVLAVSHLLFLARGVAVIGAAISTIVAVLLLYVPVLALWVRRRPIDFLDRSAAAYLRSLLAFLIVAAVVFPPFFACAHGWQLIVAGSRGFHAAGFPSFWTAAAGQLILIALPEEFYFRGYFQSTADRIFPKRWRILGASLGWGLVITAAVFAVAHTIIFYRWWHFSIFFPALLFGYLRERTGSITAPVLFHAAANLLMDWIARSYA